MLVYIRESVWWTMNFLMGWENFELAKFRREKKKQKAGGLIDKWIRIVCVDAGQVRVNVFGIRGAWGRPHSLLDSWIIGAPAASFRYYLFSLSDDAFKPYTQPVPILRRFFFIFIALRNFAFACPIRDDYYYFFYYLLLTN